jgi:hypothetical protein
MASCLGNNDPYENVPLTDAELLFFSLSYDSVPDLGKAVFSIDQRGEIGLIYNYDSLAYQTEIYDKVIVTYVSGAGTDNIINITDGDSIWVKSGDSIDISKPQLLKVYALDGKTTKLYTAQLNIHQVDPDLIQHEMIASDLPFLLTEDTKTVIFNDLFLTYSRIEDEIQLHSSTDAANWMPDIAGLPANAVISGIQSKGDQLFAYTEDGELYTRYDLISDQWLPVNKPASIKIKSILGYLNAGPKQHEGLCLVVETEGKYVFAFTQDFIQWEYNSSTPIPVNFPLYEFSNHSYQLMLTERVTIFGGLSLSGEVQNSVWSTENGIYWAKLSGSTNVFPPLRGANVIYYNNEFWLINGKLDDYYNRSVYYSRDWGVTWQTKKIFVCYSCYNTSSRPYYICPVCGLEDHYEEENYRLPEDYPERYNASVVMDKSKKYYYIIGGKYDDILPDVWKGFLNKMEFAH